MSTVLITILNLAAFALYILLWLGNVNDWLPVAFPVRLIQSSVIVLFIAIGSTFETGRNMSAAYMVPDKGWKQISLAVLFCAYVIQSGVVAFLPLEGGESIMASICAGIIHLIFLVLIFGTLIPAYLKRRQLSSAGKSDDN